MNCHSVALELPSFVLSQIHLRAVAFSNRNLRHARCRSHQNKYVPWSNELIRAKYNLRVTGKATLVDFIALHKGPTYLSSRLLACYSAEQRWRFRARPAPVYWAADVWKRKVRLGPEWVTGSWHKKFAYTLLTFKFYFQITVNWQALWGKIVTSIFLYQLASVG